MKLLEIYKNTIDDSWNIIEADSKWMNDNGLDHWITYYTKERMLEKLVHGNIYCMYDENNTAVSTISLSHVQPEYYPSKDLLKFSKANSPIYISALAVHPNYHGKGFAKLMIQEILILCKKNNYDYIRFDARNKYTKLIEFYKKLGFKIVGIMDDEGEDYALFELKI